MTQLARTRRQVHALRRHRQLVRWGSALAPLATGTLLILAAFWLVDFSFQLDATQRIVMLLICGLSLLWVFLRFAKPLLWQRESIEDVALIVERQHGIDSDLIAAMQFDTQLATVGGSPELEQAVIEDASSLGAKIDFFAGTSYELFSRRAFALALVAMLAVGVAVVFPDHVRVFFQRLLLGGDHYPTKTIMETVKVNGTVVLSRAQHPTQPEDCAAAEGQPVTMFVQCVGPSQQRREAATLQGELRIAGTDGGKKTVPLELLSLPDRLARLEEATIRLQEAIADPSISVSERWLDGLAPTVAFDAPQVRDHVRRAREDRTALPAALLEIRRTKGSWPGASAEFALMRGHLERLIEPLSYQLHVGDAWTDPARIEMIPLPVITLDLEVVPPTYAARSTTKRPTGSRQLSVLEGTTVNVALRSANDKQLAEAWVRVSNSAGKQRFDLTPPGDQQTDWNLSVATPFTPVTEEFSFEVQIRDVDGLQLEAPIRGYVRLRTDRPPTATMELVHRVVLPSAKPVVSCRVTDDFGISRLLLHLSVQRQHNDGLDRPLPGAAAAPEPSTANQHTQELALPSTWLPVAQLPYHGRQAIDMAALDLNKGDQVKLVLEAFDYRGEADGKSTLSEPVVLDISDESGVLAAIAEADEASEERLTEVIKEQLGIGDKE